MKILKYLTLILGVMFFASCEKEVEEETDPILKTANGYEYSFKDQSLQGTFNGTHWEANSAHMTTWDFDDGSHTYYFYLSESAPSWDCSSLYEHKTRFVRFSIDAYNLTLGKTELSGLWDEGDYQTATFETEIISSVETNTYNYAEDGVIEITEIDEVNNTVTLRMDIKFDDNNIVNGNFTVKMCE